MSQWQVKRGNFGYPSIYEMDVETGAAYLIAQTFDAHESLIAAAPEMLGMLVRLEYWFDTDAEILDAMEQDERADHVLLLKRIRAVIAQAKGVKQ
jgi:hypothetical protein